MWSNGAMDVCSLPAMEMASLLARGQISACELLDAHLSRIEALNPIVNALVTLTPELALERATAADEAHARGESLGLLHGLPVAHKDLLATAGIRTTFGSPIFSDFLPPSDSLAARMLPLCDGSDLGGSLRNPAAFCNIVGFRPSPGRVPAITAYDPWSPLPVRGPMARTVADVALYLRAMAGPDPRSPVSIDQSPDALAGSLERDLTGTRVAWSPDAGGLPVDPSIRAALENAPDLLADLGCEVVETWPDLSDAAEIFHARRAWLFAVGYAPLLDQHRDLMKATVIWNIEAGLKMTIAEYAEVCRRHRQLIARVHDFMRPERGGFDFLAAPVTQVPPFPVDVEYPTEIDGTRMETYIDWMRSCSDVTVTTHPTISVPGSFTPDGLPVGLQLVGRYHADRSVLELAHAWERTTGWGERLPPEITTSGGV